MYYILYKTTNLLNDKYYIGIHKTKDLEDGYLGSGYKIKNAYKKYGKENFKREILEFCKNYDELLEREKIIVNEELIKDPNSYNLKTGGQQNGILSQESKEKISKTLKEKFKSGECIAAATGIKKGPLSDKYKKKVSQGLKEFYKNNTHNNLGKPSWNKGKKGVQQAWNKGLKMSPRSKEANEKTSQTLKERYKNQPHHSIGSKSWCAGTKGQGIVKSCMKGIKLEKFPCKYCDKECSKMNLAKWHNDKCKLNPNKLNLVI